MHLLKIYSTEKATRADLQEARRKHQVTGAGNRCADALRTATEGTDCAEAAQAPLYFKAEKEKETTRFGSWGL